MNTIKFSHRYRKLDYIEEDHQVVLLQVLKVSLSELSKEFIEYDTRISENNYFKLESKDNLLLIFRDSKYKIFTTIRRVTPEKEKYYKSKIGEKFEIKIEIAQ